MNEKRTTKEDILRYLAARDGHWLSGKGCDICAPLKLYAMETYINDAKDYDPPWFCDNHARELGLMW